MSARLDMSGSSRAACGRRLRITAWERYMAFDHGSRHTMTCFSRFWLSRPVDRSEFAAAVTAVAGDNPLLAARRQGSAWKPLPFDPDRQIDWDESDAPVTLRHLSPDDMLVRWTVRVGRLRDLGASGDELAAERLDDARGTLVVLRYPHAISDALGAVALMRQVCGVLAGRPVAPPTPADLDGRHTLRHCIAAWRRVLPDLAMRVAKGVLNRPTAFAPVAATDRAIGEPQVGGERIVLTGGAAATLLAAARRERVSLNDLLLAGLFRALAPLMDPRAVIRIAVPVSLRVDGNRAFCNQVSMVFLDRAINAVQDPALLGSVSTEMTRIKRLKLGRGMHLCLCIIEGLGLGALRRSTRSSQVWATAVLSNVGAALPAGDDAMGGTDIVGHDLLPPLRPGTNLALAAVGHRGRLSLTARYAPDLVPAACVRDLLTRTVAEAAAMAASQPSVA